MAVAVRKTTTARRIDETSKDLTHFEPWFPESLCARPLAAAGEVPDRLASLRRIRVDGTAHQRDHRPVTTSVAPPAP